MLESLKKTVFEANMEIYRKGLVIYSFGNVSGIDRGKRIMGIKPSGIPYQKLSFQDIVLVNLDGKIVDGDYRPSMDTNTHLILYRKFDSIGGIVHTHATHATAWAQARRAIPCYGTTHADHFYGEIPVTAPMSDEAIERDYETETGKMIVQVFTEKNPSEVPGVLVANHGPFSWGQTPAEAVYNMVLMEEMAKIALLTEALNPDIKPIKHSLLNKHYLRKHGKNAYYGQTK
ncbi:L-ribulose-5-phosphate 4-epimerase [candidate division KSB1 bacterium]|nr:L-ribulose-5-phosphate 4-epimerase [candidate division KSB1 bacterium]